MNDLNSSDATLTSRAGVQRPEAVRVMAASGPACPRAAGVRRARDNATKPRMTGAVANRPAKPMAAPGSRGVDEPECVSGHARSPVRAGLPAFDRQFWLTEDRIVT